MATNLITTKWITCLITRHADFGGGTIEADLPDTPGNRESCIKVLRSWTQRLPA